MVKHIDYLIKKPTKLIKHYNLIAVVRLVIDDLLRKHTFITIIPDKK